MDNDDEVDPILEFLEEEAQILTKHINQKTAGNVDLFKTYSKYNREFDRIVFITRDFNECSIAEIKINDVLYILKDLNPQNNRYVGFAIWSLKDICMINNLPHKGIADPKNIVDVIINQYGCSTEYVDEVYRMLAFFPRILIPD